MSRQPVVCSPEQFRIATHEAKKFRARNTSFRRPCLICITQSGFHVRPRWAAHLLQTRVPSSEPRQSTLDQHRVAARATQPWPRRPSARGEARERRPKRPRDLRVLYCRRSGAPTILIEALRSATLRASLCPTSDCGASISTHKVLTIELVEGACRASR